MSKTKPSPNFVRDYRARFPISGARINVAQAVNYWRFVAKELPPDHCLSAMQVLISLHPPHATEQPTAIESRNRSIEQIEAWIAERELLELETLRWLNAPLNAEGPSPRM
jgi:hypothetical protein